MTPAAFDALVAAHTDKLCRFVYRYVGSREEAEDIVQEVFLVIWERGYDWADGHDPLPFLYKAAHNRAISHSRRTAVRDRFQAQASGPEPAANVVDTDVAESELSEALARAIERLPEKCRLVFTMSREQGLTHGQIAQMLGLSQKTVESHIWRALTSLRASLAPYLSALLLTIN